MKRLVAAIVSIAAAAGMLLLTPGSPAHAAWSCPTPTGVESGDNVAVLVHGWLGSATSWENTSLLQDALGDEWSVVTFDYKDLNTKWPSSSDATACLGGFGLRAQELTGKTVPSVYLVGHSMGGIMSRFALYPDNADVPRFAAGVVTMDTPHTGSPWGDSTLGALWQRVNDFGGGGDAAGCLALHHPGSLPSNCGYPPALAPSVPVAQIAGNVKLTRSWLWVNRQEVDTMSDGIVWLDSQVGYKTSLDNTQANTVESSYSVYCESSWKEVTAAGVNLGLGSGVSAFQWITGETFNLMQSGSSDIADNRSAVAVLGTIGAASSCGHTKITTNQEATNAAANYLKTWAAARTWLISADGIGPARFDMTQEQANAALGSRLLRCDGSNSGGWFASVWGDESTPTMMFAVAEGTGTSGKIPGAPQTSGGVTLGTTEQELIDLGYTRGTSGHTGGAYEWQENGVDFAADVYDGRVYAIVVGMHYFPAGFCS